MQNMNNVVAVLTAAVDAAAFSSVDEQKLVSLVHSRPSGNNDDDELSALVVVACKSHSSNIVDVLSDCWTRLRPRSTTLATPSQTLLTLSRCSSSLLRISLHNSTGL